MKKTRLILPLIFLLTLATAAGASDFTTAKHPDTFRGMAWRTPLADLPDLLPIQESGFKNSYFKKNEKLTFGDAELISVAYYFREDKLYRVGVAFSGRANHFLIKDRLLSMYGRGRGVGSRYGWMWPDFSVEITFDDKAKTGALYYTYEGSLD
ncbi:hypothetical protein [Pseudodesulfovibrio piezophilus]|uniref:Uncharacterized protein n=1 Tax=Pseudodesulfovibrio piezophilus (strain DSM 21447 / JCM 15486 / C1TLV30) TaxID=1322246 RepID=M1WTK0_PSEP2|nr:hypothetical protein [Pseudodesulfovibrio piezophilus]CCH49657.1 conserved exported protein of unknown function [Pseudodesulfovibrio piezophilus C1TLV30]